VNEDTMPGLFVEYLSKIRTRGTQTGVKQNAKECIVSSIDYINAAQQPDALGKLARVFAGIQ
jgi:hypothetical protein